jgi:hypothetical protein
MRAIFAGDAVERPQQAPMLSDWLSKRTALTPSGYGIAALTKPLFPFVGSYAVVFAARVRASTPSVSAAAESGRI